MTLGWANAASTTAALRIRRSRAWRRQSDVIVSLEIGPSVISDLVALQWLGVSDLASKDAVARALVNLIEQAAAMRITLARSDGISFTPLRNQGAERNWVR